MSVRADPLLTGMAESDGPEPWAEELRSKAREAMGDREFAFDSSIDVSASRALHVMADQRDVDLLVLGSSDRGHLASILPGRTAERLLHAGPCAIAVAPRGFASKSDPQFRSIAVAVDAGDQSRRAVEEAASEAERQNATLKLVTVAPPITPTDPKSGNPMPLIEGVHDDARQSLNEGLALVPDGISVTGVVLDGDPAQTLIEASEDLISCSWVRAATDQSDTSCSATFRAR